MPENLKEGWFKVYNSACASDGEKKSILMANAWVKNQLPTREKFIKRSAVTLQLYTREGFIKRSDDGDDYITFILNSTETHADGKKFDEAMLKEWAEYINKNPSAVGGGDIDHMLYDSLYNSNLTDEQLRTVLKQKKGIAKMVQAIYDEGKLWIRAIIDKRYRKVIEKAKGVSAEAFISQYEGNTVKKAELLGFTFNVNTTPADVYAGIHK